MLEVDSHVVQAIRRNVESVKARIRAACARCGRDPADVALIGVTKRKPPGTAVAAVAAGIVDLGENYAQELVAKAEIVAKMGANPRWHFIGALQTNKVRSVLPVVQSIHSVDRRSLVKELGKRVAPSAHLPIFIEVNIGGEHAKAGAGPDEVEDLCAMAMGFPGLHLAGLMCVPPYTEDPEDARPYFRRLAELRRDLVGRLGTGPGVLDGLSMGMTHDLEVAVEEGATVVRVGTALFGPRD